MCPGTVSVKPYLLAGIGGDGYTLIGNAGALGYQSRGMGTVPLGAGIRARAGHFIAEARFNYNWEFGQTNVGGFNPFTLNTWRYQGQLQVGGAF